MTNEQPEGPVKVEVRRIVLHCRDCRHLGHGPHIPSGRTGFFCRHRTRPLFWLGKTDRTRAWCPLWEKGREG